MEFVGRTPTWPVMEPSSLVVNSLMKALACLSAIFITSVSWMAMELHLNASFPLSVSGFCRPEISMPWDIISIVVTLAPGVKDTLIRAVSLIIGFRTMFWTPWPLLTISMTLLAVWL